VTIRKRLLLLLSLSLAGFLLIVWFGIRPFYENALLDERKVIISQYLEGKSERIDEQFDHWIRMLFEFELAVSANPQGIERQFQNLSGIYPDLLKIRLNESESGEFLEVIRKSIHPQPVPDSWSDILKPVESSSNILVGWDTEYQIIILSKSVQTQSGRQLTLTAFFNDSSLRELITNTKLGQSSAFSALWFDNNSFLGGTEQISDAIADLHSENPIRLTSVTTIYTQPANSEHNQSPVLVATTPLKSVPYWLNLSIDQNTVTQPIDRLFLNTLYVLFGGFILLFVSAGILSRYINRPVQKLVDQILPMKSYNFSNIIDKPGLPELRPAAETMEQVRRQLQRYQQANVEQMLLQDSRLNLLMDNSSQMLALFDESESATLVNKRMRELMDDSGFEQELTWENLQRHSAVEVIKKTKNNRWSEKMLIELEDQEWQWTIPAARVEDDQSPEMKYGYVENPKNEEQAVYNYTFNVKYLKALADGYILKGSMLIMYDLTQQREMDKKRDEMIHFIMHELKNPLSGLAGIIEILQDDTLGKETTGFYFNLIENNVNKLFTLTNRFLEVIKLENNEIQIVKESLDLKQELDNLNTSFFAQMQEKNITLKIELIPPVEIIYASNHHFQDILSNILSNAIKYGPESRSIYIQAKQNDKKSTVLSFTDYGYGIDKSELDHIFEKFYRIKRMDSETGTGLGLTYVKKMIEAHGGHVEVESNEEIGTKFTLTFPNR